MDCTLEFTCVPIGKQNGLAFVDVLVVPKCYADPAPLQQWTGALQDTEIARGFTLNGKVLTLLGADRLQRDLWRKLFQGASPGAKLNLNAPHAAPVAPHGSRLIDVHTLSHDFFHDTYVNSVGADYTHTQKLDKQRILTLHSTAIEKHGLYRAVPRNDAIDPTKATDIGKNLQNIPPEDRPFTDRLALARLRTQPAVLNSQSQAPEIQYTHGLENATLRTPDAALVGLSQVQVHLATSKAAAVSPIATRRNGPGPQAPTGDPHLVVHVSRTMRTPAGRSALGAHKVAQIVATRPSFNQRVTMLLNAPSLLEALGLVLHFSLPSDELPASTQPVSLDPSCTALTRLSALVGAGTPVCHQTYFTQDFLPQPRPENPRITSNGWMLVGNDAYYAGSLQLDSAAMQTVMFASHAGLRHADANGDLSTFQVTRRLDEDVEHPILPPSPVTAGFYVWKHDLQNEVYQRRSDALANQTGNPQKLYAEDLQNSIVVDVAPFGEEKNVAAWERLCLRDEEYDIGGTVVRSEQVERGVRVSSLRNAHSGTTQSLAHDVDETLFNWHYGSLVGKTDAGHGQKALATAHRTPSSARGPWSYPPPRVKTACQDSPIFGTHYTASMRAGFITGSVVPFDPAKADLFKDHPFLRYELMQGPVTVPVTKTNNRRSGQAAGLMFVASKIDAGRGDKPTIYTEVSQCLLVPPRVSAAVARWHGKKRDDIAAGSELVRKHLMRRNGDLIATLPFEETDPTKTVDQEFAPYLPDPLVNGIIADLLTLDGNVEGTASLNFHSGADWPNFLLHSVEVLATLSDKAAITGSEAPYSTLATSGLFGSNSRAIRCYLPVGETRVLVLRPKLNPDVLTQHALAAIPKTSGDALMDLTYSDICRPTFVRLTHATDKPKRTPTITTVTISEPSVASGSPTPPPNVSATVEVHPGSTSKVSLWAEWTEYRDEKSKPAPEISPARVQIASAELSKTAHSSVSLIGQLPFGDSKHRNVKFTAVATSRYGPIVEGTAEKVADPAQLGSKITSTSPVQARSRKALAQPLAPDVELLLPNLNWALEKPGERTRSMGLSIVINRPWYTSGEGEQLAVLTGVPNEPDGKISTFFAAANAENNVSAWGLYSDFRDTKVGQDQSYIDLLKTPQSTSKTITAGGKTHAAGLFTPQYNKDDQQWYVNLSFSNPPAYGAVVRLVVLRYQAEATTDDKQSSPVVLCDFLLLRPGRSLIVKRSRGQKTIEIRGTASPKNTRFSVNRYKSTWSGKDIFDMEAAGTVNGQPGANDVLWTATLSGGLFRHKYLIEEFEDWPSADDAGVKQQMLVYSDIIEI